MNVQHKIEIFRDLIYSAHQTYQEEFSQALHLLEGLNPNKSLAENYKEHIHSERDPLVQDYLESNIPILLDPKRNFDGELFQMLFLTDERLVLRGKDETLVVYNFLKENNINMSRVDNYLFWKPLLTKAAYNSSLFSFLQNIRSLREETGNHARFLDIVVNEVQAVLPFLKPRMVQGGHMVREGRNATGDQFLVIDFDLPKILLGMFFNLHLCFIYPVGEPDILESSLLWCNSVYPSNSLSYINEY